MSEAFPLVEGATCAMRENGKTLPLREAVIGDVSGELYADVGPLLLKLTPKADGSYEDHQGRIWDVNGIDRCPICAEPFKLGDVCATDIELLTVHAECLDGCEIVDLETGEPTDKPLSTFPYSDLASPASETNVVPAELCDLTFAIQHNPRCPSPWLVRLVGKSGIIDMKPYGGPFAFMKHETADRLGFGKTLEEAARNALATDEGQGSASHPEAPEPVGYIGKASLDMMRSGQTAACAMTQVPPKVKEVVALFEHPSPQTRELGSTSSPTPSPEGGR